MGVRTSASLDEISQTPDHPRKQNFSDDVLKIEMSGPDRSHFSILDVPGIFQSRTRDLTDRDKNGVRDRGFVLHGVKAKHHSVCPFTQQRRLVADAGRCVVSGTNDVANQAVLEMVSQQDKNGESTIGVIAKCDVKQHEHKVYSGFSPP